MFPNLTAELEKMKISTKDFAFRLGISERTARNKLAGKTEFTLAEGVKIGSMFPDEKLDYLFYFEENT